MDPLTISILVAGGLGLYALRNKGSVSTGGAAPTGLLTGGADPANSGGGLGISFAAFGPNSDPRNWYQGIKPGTVIVNEQTVSHFDGNGNLNLAQTAAGFTATGISAAEGISVAVSHAGLFAGSTLGTAIPIVGVGVAIVGTVLGVISAHHKAAQAAEGRALNSADPRAIDSLVLIVLGVLKGEIPSVTAAQGQIQQTITAYYGEVKPVEKGRWPYKGVDLNAGFRPQGTPKPPKGSPAAVDYYAPDPCNGPCVVGHFYIERGGILVLNAIKDIFLGNHGQLVLPAIPPHDAQSGFPQVQVVY